MNTKLRYLGIPIQKNVEVPGFCLDYMSKKDAEAAAAILSKYSIASQQRKGLKVRIQKIANEKIRFSLNAQWGDNEFKIEIEDIDKDIVGFVKCFLEKVQYYFIVIGYTVGEKFELMPPSELSLFKSEIEIFGSLIKGNNIVPIDWMNIFSVKDGISFS